MTPNNETSAHREDRAREQLAAMQKKKIKVMESVGALEKDKKNQQQGYGYLSDDAISAAVQTAMAAAGLALTLPRIDEYTETELQTKSGGALHCVRIRAEFGLVDSENGTVETGVVYGTGMDSGDKALYKAMTGARKYFFRLAFGIGTGNDGDAESVERGQQRQQQRPPAQQPPSKPTTPAPPKPPARYPGDEVFAGMAIPPAAWRPLSALLVANADGDEARAIAVAQDMHDAGMRWGDGTRKLEDMANEGKAIIGGKA